MEAIHRKEICAIKQDIQILTTRVTAGKASLSTKDQSVTALEALQNSHTEAAMGLQLHLEEMVDWIDLICLVMLDCYYLATQLYMIQNCCTENKQRTPLQMCGIMMPHIMCTNYKHH